MIAVRSAGPSFTILYGSFRLPCPSGVIERWRHGVRRRSHAEKIGDHYFVESDERMVNLPCPLRRPVPVKKITGRSLAIPIPLDRFPELRDSAVEGLLAFAGPVKILARRQQALHQEGSLDQVSAVVEHPEHRHGTARVAVHVVRPRSVIALGVCEEVDDLCQPLRTLFAGNEAAIDANDERHDAEPARPGGDDSLIAGNIFARHAGVRIGPFPVVLEARLLQHRKQFVIR